MIDPMAPTGGRQALEARLIAKAMRDETFRQDLLADPRRTIERELGLAVPAGMEIEVHEETPTSLHLVLPAVPATTDGELSDVELEAVAGGKSSEEEPRTNDSRCPA